MKAICNLDVHVDSKAPKPSSQTKEVPQGKNPGAKSGLRRKQSSKHTSESKTKASKSKTSQSKKETQSRSAKDKNPSHPSPPTLVVSEMHKEAQQAACGLTSLGATSEEGAHPQLGSGHDASTDSTTETDHGLSAPNDSIPSQQADEISKKIKLKDLSDILKDTRFPFFTPDSPQDEPIIVSDESEQKEEVAKDKDTHASFHDKDELEQQKAKAEAEVASLKARSSYPDINQLTDLLVTSLKPEFSKLLASHDFSSCLPTEMKEFPSKFNKLSRDIKELTKHVRDMEIELHGDLKEIPTKPETFTSTISNLTSKVAELKNIQGTSKAGVSKLLQLATMMENASRATTKDVPSACQATASPAEGGTNNSDNVLPANNNSLEHYNSALELFKHENNRLMELLISQDLVHIAVNFLAVINDYKSVEQRFLDEYKENLEIQTELDKKNMTEMAVYRNDVPDLKIGLEKLGVSSSTKASESNPRSNTKKDRITQTSSSNKKTNKVEDQPRIAKSSLNNLNRVSKIVCNANVKHYVLNTNSKLICATCHECMFDAIHDLCVRDYLVDVNARVKSQYVKSKNAKSTKKRMWKPTGKVYTNVGYRFGNNQIAKIMGYGDYETGNVTISRVYYVEGLGQQIVLHDEAPEVIIKCLKQIQVRINAIVRNIRTDNGTVFVNQTLKDYYENVRISHQTSVVRTPQQNGIVER
ncbi:retrovirus-related pol polyprotein from transposon TNT 1-94 [Tanacetum coccineum]